MLSRPALSKEDECALCAMIDIAVDAIDGLGNSEITSLPVACAVLRRIALPLSIYDVARRIGHSSYPAELLAYLPHIYGSNIRSLRRTASAVYQARSDFDSTVLTAFADQYWTNAFKQKLAADDIAGAYNIIKLATLGAAAFDLSVDYVLKPFTVGEPVGLLVSLYCGRVLVQDLHARLVDEKKLPDTLKMRPPEAINWDRHWPAGIMVAEAIGGYEPGSDSELTSIGLQAIALGLHAATLTASGNDMIPEEKIPVFS